MKYINPLLLKPTKAKETFAVRRLAIAPNNLIPSELFFNSVLGKYLLVRHRLIEGRIRSSFLNKANAEYNLAVRQKRRMRKMKRNSLFVGGMLIGFVIGALMMWGYAASMNMSTDGYFFDGAREMGFSVKTYETKTYYLGGNQFVRISNKGFDEGPVQIERFVGETPTLADLDMVNQACFGNMPSMQFSLEHREVKVHGIWYNCRYIISGFDDLESEQYVNAYGYDGSTITVWSDANFENELEPLPNGSVLQVVNTETNEFMYQGKKVFTNNDCVSYFIAVPPSK